MVTFAPRLALPHGAAAPDSFRGDGATPPHDRFVISRMRDQREASYYRDAIWDFTAYTPEGMPARLYFEYWGTEQATGKRLELARELRWIIFLHAWKAHGRPLSFSTLLRYLWGLRFVARYCENAGCSIGDVFADPIRLIELVGELPGGAIGIISTILKVLRSLGASETGWSVVDKKTIQTLRGYRENYRKALLQHPPLPTRVYSSLISNLARELDEFEAIADRYLALVRIVASDPMMGRGEIQQFKIARRLGIKRGYQRPTFDQLLSEYNLDAYFAAKGLLRSCVGLVSGLSEVQMSAKLLLQVFSGMRDDEAISLPHDCLREVTNDGRLHFILTGRTTKLHGGRVKQTEWITSRDGARAVRISQRVADAIYGVIGATPGPSDWRTRYFPLFISPTYLPLTGNTTKTQPHGYRPSRLIFAKFPELRARLEPLIGEKDIQELEQIDPHRAWRSESWCKAGAAWFLKSHQLRRSLALYAQRSGLVSLPSLRRQLHHITEEMSRYYARGSAFAKNFIGDDKQHFGNEWQDTQPVSAALSYIANVLLSDDVLFGGHANWMEHRLRGNDGVVAVDRAATIRRFRKGELSYRETFLGGCTNTEECNQIALKWLDVDCLAGCRNMVGNLTKLNRVIAAQTRLVESLDSNSVEFKAEKADLDVLVATRNKVVGQTQTGSEAAL